MNAQNKDVNVKDMADAAKNLAEGGPDPGVPAAVTRKDRNTPGNGPVGPKQALTNAPVNPRARRYGKTNRLIWAHAVWSCVVGMVLLGVAIVALVAAMGRALEAPGWLRVELSRQIEAALDNRVHFDFGELSLVFGEEWRPGVRFRDLVLTRPDGQELLHLDKTEVSFSVSSLMAGKVRPRRILLTGAFATVKTGKDGTVALALGNTAAPLEEAQSLAQLIKSRDALLEQPFLSQLAGVDVRALTLQYESARAGRAWTVDGGRVQAYRKGQQLRIGASFSLLSGRDYAGAVEMNYTSRIGDPASGFGVFVQDIAAEDIAAQTAALSWLEVLRAPVSGGFRGSIEADGALGPVHATLDIGAGVLQPAEATRPIPFSRARTYITYRPEEQMLVFDAVTLDSPWASGVAEGTAYHSRIKDGRLNDLAGQISLSKLAINPDGLYTSPMEIADVTVDFRLQLAPFRLTLDQMHTGDGLGSILASGELTAAPDGWDVALDGRVERMTPERLLQIWPEGVAVNPRKWVAGNVLNGTLHDVNFALRAHPGKAPDLHLDFDFADATVRLAKFLPPAEGVSGRASLLNHRFDVAVLDGTVDNGDHGQVRMAGSTFVIPDVRIRPGTPATVLLESDGPVAAFMALLDRPPLSILKNTDLPVGLAKGWIRAGGTLEFPLKQGLQFYETDFTVSGTVEDVESTVLLPGHRITAPSLQVHVTPVLAELKGAVDISGLPIVAHWQQPIGQGEPQPGRLNGTVALSEQALETFNVDLPPESLRGAGDATFRMELPPGAPPRLALSSDLRGVRLAIPALGWAKPAAGVGQLEIEARLGPRPEVSRLWLSAAGLSAEGRITTRADGSLERATFSSVRLGDWLNAPVELVGRGKAVPVALRIGGGLLDVRGATFAPGGGESGPMEISLDRLKITDSIVLHDFRGRFTSKGGLSGQFSGLLGGRTPVTGDVIPDHGRSAFRLWSDDAGGVLRDAGLRIRAHGGDFALTLKPTGAAGTFDGNARIHNLRVIDTPLLAALLDAVSIIGLIDDLAGSGILFGKVVTRFRLTPDAVTVYQGSAEGPSIGMSMDGTYDVAARRLDMQGVISPLYLINGIGSLLTRRGEGLIGFNYTLRGPAEQPEVRVNPLSALMPGLLREALRRPPPKESNRPEPGAARSNPGIADHLEGSASGR